MASAWTPGETFNDAANKIKIEVLGATSNGFEVRLTRGEPPSGPTPTPTLAPTPTPTAPPGDVLALQQPAHQGVVVSNNVTFTWDGLIQATSYRIKLKRKDVPKLITIRYDASCGNTCSYTPDYAALGWKWNDNGVYTWKVVAKGALGDTLAKTTKHKFTTDLMPETINVISPANGYIMSGTTLTTQFSSDARVEQYRLIVKRGAEKQKTAWSNAVTVCSAGTCTMTMNLNVFSGGATNGAYSVKVRGRSSISANKVASPKHTFTVSN